MSYTVLARKYRSRNFDDLVGQEAIATTLKNAVTSDRVHHGYLFTGTRGVGKTSSARILAKALNCFASETPTPDPCCECESCRHIAEGEDIDVIEIDAASNTGVDNIRDLRDNTAYRPARARFKIYIIDEVHMLSTGAFNALLKTLEEPPDHVKFVLATTEIQKVPATIVSRCQRFDFRSISPDDIAARLNHILEQEKIEAEDSAVRRVARLANGSMRDALSLLDQLLSFGSGKLTADTLDDVLPAAHDETIAELFERLCEQDPAGALRCVESSLAAGQTIDRFCELLISHLRTAMLINVCGSETDLIDLPAAARQSVADQADRFDAPTLVYMISLAEEVRRASKTSTAARALLDAAIVRLAAASRFSDIETLLERLDGDPPPRSAAPPAKPRSRAPAPTATPARSAESKSKAPTKARRTPPARDSVPPPTTRANSADEARARANPEVQRAMELFEGTLVSVERTAPPPTKNTAEPSEDDSDQGEPG